MRKKKLLGILTAAALCLGMTGCGEDQMPELTDAQVKEIGQYVAFILMKYNSNGGSRLVELTEQTQKPSELEESAGTESEEPSGMAPVDDTPVVDAPGQTVQEYTLEEVMGLPEGIKVGYAGEEICSVYPDEDAEDYFAITATDGKQLLVLKFFLANNSGRDQTVDLLSWDAAQEDLIFQITVNGEYRRRALNTMLLDDLGTLKCDIAADGVYNAVLVIEVDQGVADTLETIELSVKCGDKACSVQVR